LTVYQDEFILFEGDLGGQRSKRTYLGVSQPASERMVLQYLTYRYMPRPQDETLTTL